MANENMQKVIDGLVLLGWVEDGRTQQETFRLPTKKSPVYGAGGYGGGELVTMGGRLRFKFGDWRVTIGKQTTYFYARKECPDGRSKKLKTKNFDDVLTMAKEFQTFTAKQPKGE